MSTTPKDLQSFKNCAAEIATTTEATRSTFARIAEEVKVSDSAFAGLLPTIAVVPEVTATATPTS